MSAVDALGRIAASAERLEGRARKDIAPYRNPERTYDGCGRQVPRNPFRSKAGVVLLLRMPGFAAQWRKVVPCPEHTLGPWVLCRCEELFAIDVGEVAECPRGCGRWYLRTEESLRWVEWPREDVEREDVAA